MWQRTLNNISERELIALIAKMFVPPVRMTTREWAISRRTISSKETSVGVGRFDPDITPYMEYVYECLDNPRMPEIVAMKSARIAWTETINNYRGKRIETNPCAMLLGFATKEASRSFAKFKWTEFLNGVPELRKIINVGVAKNKESIFDYIFPNGMLRLVTLGAISNQKSDNFPYIEIEEPDDAKDDVKGQGDTLANLQERQKTIPTTLKKLIFGGTPTNKDFSRVEKAIKASNWLEFKAECHECKELIPMTGTTFNSIRYEEYPDRYIDDRFGKNDPSTAKFYCPACDAEWSFEQKNKNIINGKQHGFIDHTGNFSKGWHPRNPNITDVIGFSFSELLSPFDASNFPKLAQKEILANIERAKGNEKLLKSYYNNTRGMPYASGISMMEVEDMVKLRCNYPENIVPMEALELTIGIDVQHNRFAITVLGWGRFGCVWAVTWTEIFGNVFNPEDKVWQDLTDFCAKPFKHATGNDMYAAAVSIDSGDGSTTELVYKWVLFMNENTHFNGQVRATKGVKELKYSPDEIYSEPREINPVQALNMRKTLAETMGVKVYHLGAHRAHEEILRRIGLNLINGCKTDRFYFCEFSYGNFEEQMLSCRKIIDETGNSTRATYKLVSGKRKEAIDACKNAFHAAYAIEIRNYTNEAWEQRENYYTANAL